MNADKWERFSGNKEIAPAAVICRGLCRDGSDMSYPSDSGRD